MDKKKNDITESVKNIIHAYDINATVILFGSRARGDWQQESDWDFLILTDKKGKELQELDKKLHRDIWEQIELISFANVQFILRNRQMWEQDLWMTDLSKSIKEEGILI